MDVSEKHLTELIGFAECWMLWAREPVTQDGTIYQEKVEEGHVWGRGRKQSFRHVESEALVRHSCYCEGGAIPILPARHKATEAEIVYTTCQLAEREVGPRPASKIHAVNSHAMYNDPLFKESTKYIAGRVAVLTFLLWRPKCFHGATMLEGETTWLPKQGGGILS